MGGSSMILHAITIGIAAWIFVMILMEPGMIFYKWNDVLNKLPDWLAYPLGRCEYCLAGQLSLWYFFTLGDYNFFYHIGFISIAIFTVRIINHIINTNYRTWS